PIGAAGESGYATGDPLHPGVIYGGDGTRWDLETNVSVPGTTPPRGTETNRADWTQPLVLSAAEPQALYYASQFLFKTTDGARTWTKISGDLTRPDPGIPSTLDEAAAADTDRNGRRGVIYAAKPSPLRGPTIWIGTDDGLIQLTSDGGTTWRDVTPNSLTPWSRVTAIEASHFDADTAYASVDRHQLQDFEPYIQRTRDQGRTWEAITTGLPAGVYVHVVKEDTVRRGLLFAGTERGAFVSFDDGDHWQPLQRNLPVTSVRDFVVYGNDLIVATHGRGFWVMDDISALRQTTDAVLQADAFLFKPADAINVMQGGDNGTPLQRDEPQAGNPPDGAAIDYWLRSAAPGSVTLEILDANGRVLRTWPGSGGAGGGPRGGGGGGGGIPRVSPLWVNTPVEFATSAGMHRVVWRPVAPVAPTPGGGGGGGGFRRAGVTLLTGTFNARLTVNGQVLTQTFVVRPDPRPRPS
ncbi:MAG: WD40/YVTN/BNR-like repeat-containing protein, partial [Acidimicrobiales bacterium]